MANSKKPETKGHERRSEPRRVVNERCGVEIHVEGEVFEGIAVDVSKLGVGVFLSERLTIGTEVKLVILSSRFEVTLPVQVIWCNALPSSKNIIKSSTTLPWKMGLQFAPKTDEERKIAELIFQTL